MLIFGYILWGLCFPVVFIAGFAWGRDRRCRKCKCISVSLAKRPVEIATLQAAAEFIEDLEDSNQSDDLLSAYVLANALRELAESLEDSEEELPPNSEFDTAS